MRKVQRIPLSYRDTGNVYRYKCPLRFSSHFYLAALKVDCGLLIQKSLIPGDGSQQRFPFLVRKRASGKTPGGKSILSEPGIGAVEWHLICSINREGVNKWKKPTYPYQSVIPFHS